MEDLMYYPDLPEEPVIIDRTCDPDNPVVVTVKDVKEAQAKIQPFLMKTPCHRSRLSDLYGMEIYLKKEILHYTGCFKERGACNFLLRMTPAEKEKGVIAASAGNHAQAMAYHGRNQKISVKLVMPIIAPITKVNRCKALGAQVILEGKDMEQTKNAAMRIGKEEGRIYCNGYDNPHILSGAGTIGLEILTQVPDVAAVVVPSGGGGLLAGVTAAIRGTNPNVKIVGAESERCTGMTTSLKAGKVTKVPAGASLADGLLVPTVGVNSFATIKSHGIHKMVEVQERSIAIAILRLTEEEKCIAEGAGATSLAAVLEGHLNEFKGKKVVLLVSGANIDTSILARCLERGLAADGRLTKVVVTISDRPGGIRDLTEILYQNGVNIRDMAAERAWVDRDVFSVAMTLILETRDIAHTKEIHDVLKKNFKDVRIYIVTNTDS